MTDMPTAITKPSDWLAAIEVVVTGAITTYGLDGSDPTLTAGEFKVGLVKYRPGAGVAVDETCKGALALDVVDWYATMDPWPTPRNPAMMKSEPCGSATAMTVVLRYVSCISSPTSPGGPPPADKERAEQLALMDLGWHVYRTLLLAEQRRKTTDTSGGELHALGTTRVGRATRLPIEGGGSGFTMPVQCKLGKICT